GMGATTAATFDSDSLAQPQFEGLLSQAPYISTAGLDAMDRLESYRSGLSDFVQSVTALYTTAENLPVLPHDEDITVVLHVSDIHLNPLAYDLIEQLVPQFHVNMVLDTGDVTSWGTEAESATLAPIGRLNVPYVFVAGNHDSALTAQTIASYPNAVVLNDEVKTVAGITWAGIADPRFLPDDNSGDGVGLAAGKQMVAQATEKLAETVMTYNNEHPDAPVDVAAIHDPSALGPLFGEVPLILSGHYHRRIDRLDATGTRVRSEGSTGGAGITSRGLERLSEGDPVPMEASLLYFAAGGEREGQLLAYDEITVGGLGLASVNLSRTIIDPDEQPADEESDDAAVPGDAGIELPQTEEVPAPDGTMTPQPGETGSPSLPEPTEPDDSTPSWPTIPIQPRPEFDEPDQ
ncbi:MAG TPA: metallophosphoesterase, partial [Actinomycetales bacterium]|nr:metallophosphoesterase [Actinomycetales bacterium]